MIANPVLRVYDPRSQTDEAFLAGFVARADFAAFLLARLRAAVDGEAEHQLIVGPRGMGKTSLLRRIAIGVGEDEALRARIIPLRFREEQYNVISLAKFWINCADSLAQWCEDHCPESKFPALVDRKSTGAEWGDAAAALDAILAETRARGARALLLIDNLDLIVEALSPSETWALRGALQAPYGPILYGTATRVPPWVGDREAAFYEFFRLHMLEPLGVAELMDCLRGMAASRGEAGRRVVKVLDSEPERLRVLHRFTGGNPRVVALTYKLLESESTDSALADLEALLDQATPYYKGRVEEYQTKLQRAVIDAIALNWDPITSHDLAAATDTEITTISSQLNRLRKDGLIEKVELAGARAGHQLVERLFNIWYLMRHGTRLTRRRVNWLTMFLVQFYSADDVRRMASERAGPASRGATAEYYAEALAAAAERIGAGVFGPEAAAERIGALASAPAGDETEYAPGYAGAAARVADLARRISAPGGATLELRVRHASALNEMGVEFRSLGRRDEAVAAFDEVDRRYGEAAEPALRERVAAALVNKGDVLADRFGSMEQAAEAYEAALRASPTQRNARAGLAWARLAANQLAEAADARRDLTDLPEPRLALLDAGLEIAADNIGSALKHLDRALGDDPQFGDGRALGDLLRLFRIVHARGHGERWIAHFEAAGHAARLAPIHAALVAFVRGERHLLNFNPEVREAATALYLRLAAPLLRAQKPPERSPRGRGRPRAPSRA